MTSRRSHVVRIYEGDDETSDTYVDVEVLDAVSFIIENGKEVILSFKKSKISPFVKDDTGGGHAKSPANPTRASHMERIKTGSSGSTYMDVEVLDCIAFSDQNGQEWILNLPTAKSVKFNQTSGGNNKASARTHDEKVKLGTGSEFTTVERTDMVAFRTVNGQEMIVKMPSRDDGTGDRADTVISSPAGYDPSKDTPKPPKNTDPNIYISLPTGSTPVTGATKVSQGMLWWIRKINVGGGIAYFSFSYGATKVGAQPAVPTATLKNAPWAPSSQFNILGDIKDPIGSNVAVVNPVSAAMKAQLNQWTPKPAVFGEAHTEPTGNTVKYFVTLRDSMNAYNASNYLEILGINQCGDESPRYACYGGNTFKNCLTNNIRIATELGFDPARLVAGGNYDTFADAQYLADAVNQVNMVLAPSEVAFFTNWCRVISFDVGKGVQGIFKKGATAVFSINMAKGAALAKAGSETFTFDVAVSACPDGQWQLSGDAYKTTKDFPLGPNNSFLFAPEKPDSGDGASNSNSPPQTVRVTVNFKEFTVRMAILP